MVRCLAPWMGAVFLAWALERLGAPFVEPGLFAAALACAFWPCSQALRRRLGRRLSSLAMASFLSVGLAVPACWAWSSAFVSIDGLVAKMDDRQTGGGEHAWGDKARAWGVGAAMKARSSLAWRSRADDADTVPVEKIALTAIALYFMLADGAAALLWAESVMSRWTGAAGLASWRAMSSAFASSSKGCLWFGLASFVALWVLFTWAGAPSPMALAVAGACASMLPFIAPVMVAMVSVAMMEPGNIIGPAALLLIGAGGLGLANNVLRPKWVGDASGIPMPAALLGMAGGAMAWGPAGLLAGPAVVAGVLGLLASGGVDKETA